MGRYWVRTTSPTNNISFLSTALAVLSSFLCSSLSPRIDVTVNRCVSANLESWLGRDGLVGESVFSGYVQHYPPTAFPR